MLDDGLYYSNGFGYSDLAKTVRPDETILFETGSLTKVITGSALLTLIDRPNSNMALDDDVVVDEADHRSRLFEAEAQRTVDRGRQLVEHRLRRVKVPRLAESVIDAGNASARVTASPRWRASTSPSAPVIWC